MGRIRIGALVLVLVLAAACIEFAPPTTHPVALAANEEVGGITVADVTGDGLADVLVHGENSPYQPSGTYRTVVMESCGEGCLTQGAAVDRRFVDVVADFNGDGADDVIMSGVEYNAVAHLYFGGPGGLDPARSVQLTNAYVLVPGDFDADDDTDLLVGTIAFGYYISFDIWRNDGTGAFTPAGSPQLSGPLNAGGGRFLVGNFPPTPGDDFVLLDWLPGGQSIPRPVAIGDIDGDGFDDIAHLEDGELVFSRSVSSTVFEPFPHYQTIEMDPFHVLDVSLLDLDGDGMTDLAAHGQNVYDTSPDRTTYLAGTGDGGFPYGPTTDVPTGPASFGDLDGDGLPDAVAATADGTGIEVWMNTAGDG